MRNQSRSIGFLLAPMALVMAITGYGWVMNILDIVAAVNSPITTMFILRCVGIFVAPLGAILGFM